MTSPSEAGHHLAYSTASSVDFARSIHWPPITAFASEQAASVALGLPPTHATRALRTWVRPLGHDERAGLDQFLVELQHPGDGPGGRRVGLVNSRVMNLMNRTVVSAYRLLNCRSTS
jgi:hypothetical protein